MPPKLRLSYFTLKSRPKCSLFVSYFEMSLVKMKKENFEDNNPDNTNEIKDEDEGKPHDLHEELKKIIQPFHFTSTTSLVDIMMLSGAVISGPAALAMVHPGLFNPDHIDFLVPSKGAPWILLHLLDHGYKVNPTSDNKQDDFDRDKLVVLTTSHPVSNKSINLIVFADTHFINHITQFHSTLVMNYVAWYGLVSLYPNWTVNKKGLIVKSSAKTRLTFLKQRENGFILSSDNITLVEVPAVHVCKADYDCPRTRRSLHDEECAFQPFEGSNSDLRQYEPEITWTLATSCKFSGITAKSK